MTISLRSLLLVGLGMTMGAANANRAFSSEERQRVVNFWKEPGRYAISAPKNHMATGLWQVRATPEGSLWLRQYSQARGLGKTAPTAIPAVQNADQKAWETWLNARIALDRANAALEARKRNVDQLGVTMPQLVDAPDPGPAPDNLVRLVAPLPVFAEAVTPMLHTVVFEDGTTHAWQDHPDMRPRFEYYRFRQGVMDGGNSMKRMPESDLVALLTKAGLDSKVRNVFGVVSLLEGGFDSINTYDTGFVSVGFIQFAALSEGGGSLARVLRRQKQDDPESFQRDFARYGVNVTPDALLAVIDPATGAERIGPDANKAIIDDKRLIAVFQRAGRLSEANRIAQLRVARDEYYPDNESLLVTVDGRILAGKVGEIIRSEAGMATLMDRKVNTGKLGPIITVLERIARSNKLQSFGEFAKFEREIIQGVKWRKDYLADSTLSQPSQKPDNSSQGRPPFSAR